MSGLSFEQQQRGFLLIDVQKHTQQIIDTIKTRNHHDLKNLLAQKKLASLELTYKAFHCFDFLFQTKDSTVCQEFNHLITTFNQRVCYITPESISTLSQEQEKLIQSIAHEISNFVTRHKMSASALVKELQQKAIRENKPITSFLRKDILMPLVLIAGIIAYYIIWKKYIYKTPQERKIAERARRTILDLDKANHTCVICDEEKTEEELEVLSCGHKYCTTDLMEMITIALREKNSSTLLCPNPQCRRPLNKEDVSYITTYDNNKITSFTKIVEKERISRDPNGTNCPTRDCPYMFINNPQRPFRVKCPECHTDYCSNCFANHPTSTNCTRADQEWLAANTKPCPNCHAPIEKDGGCDHMTCGRCRYEFWWTCLCNYRGAHSPNCPRFNPYYNQFRYGY